MTAANAEQRRAYHREYDRTHRPNRGETHTTRAGFAMARNRFVAIDGEGFDDSGRHLYVYLAASDGGHFESVYNPNGLSPRECWEFLLSLPRIFGPAIYVSYSFGYESEYWIPTNRDRVKILDETGRCLYGPYRIRLWPRKRFEITRVLTVDGKPVKGPRVRIDDVFSYFACSFEKAVEEWLPNITPLQRSVLHEGKALRGAFTRAAFEDGSVQLYNRVELQLLVLLARALKSAREDAGLQSSDFYSPANLAVALFKKYHVTIMPAPPQVEKAAYAAFFGGRIECAAFGSYFGPVYEYDINRAYPYAMSLLPDLSEGTWERSFRFRTRSRWSLYRVSWDFPEGWRFYPFPWRAENGAVFYPPRGTGWVWAPEIQPWMLKFLRFSDGWHFIASKNNIPPFGWQADVYRQTLDLKRRGLTGPAHSLKVGQNSAYGKLAQQTSMRIGEVDGHMGRVRPTFHHPCYAGLITSMTRARLWEMLDDFNSGDETEIISFCTDAVYSTSPLCLLDSADDGHTLGKVEPVSDEFGALKCETFDAMQSLQSGVYRLQKDGEWITRARGFANRNVPWDLVNEGWMNGAQTVTHVLKRFIGHRWASHQSRYHARTWASVPKEIRLGAVGKRYLAPKPKFTAMDNPSRRLYWTLPERDIGYDEVSAPNLPNFGRRPMVAQEETAEDLGDWRAEAGPYEG